MPTVGMGLRTTILAVVMVAGLATGTAACGGDDGSGGRPGRFQPGRTTEASGSPAPGSSTPGTPREPADTASPAPSDHDIAPFYGEWTGSTTPYDENKTYQIRLSLRKPTPHSDVYGKITFPYEGCAGPVRVLISTAQELRLESSIVEGYCSVWHQILLTFIGTNKVRFQWFNGFGGPAKSEGELTRS